MLSSLADGKIDLALFYPQVRSENKFKKICETLGNDNLIISRLKLNYLQDLQGKKVTIIRGAKYSNRFESIEGVNKVESSSYKQSIKMFLNKRVDAYIIPNVALKFYTINGDLLLR